MRKKEKQICQNGLGEMGMNWNFKYVMVTHWDDHWDTLPNNETHYTKKMIRFELKADKLLDRTPTLFIKLKSKDIKKPEKAWIGYVYGFKEEGDKIRFKVQIEKGLSLAEVPKKFLSLKEGWYLETGSLEPGIPHEIILYPPFFYSLLSTNNWEEFENLTFWLLKLIGIHKLHIFKEQRGKPDGFFIFGNLAVIYDCTLEEKFEETKNQQIGNYCAQLKSGKLEHEKTQYDISQSQKQVWIISKGNPRIIKHVDDITVKEVPIHALIKIYKKRIEENMDEKELEKVLANIGI